MGVKFKDLEKGLSERGRLWSLPNVFGAK